MCSHAHPSQHLISQLSPPWPQQSGSAFLPPAPNLNSLTVLCSRSKWASANHVSSHPFSAPQLNFRFRCYTHYAPFPSIQRYLPALLPTLKATLARTPSSCNMIRAIIVRAWPSPPINTMYPISSDALHSSLLSVPSSSRSLAHLLSPLHPRRNLYFGSVLLSPRLHFTQSLKKSKAHSKQCRESKRTQKFDNECS